jgi:hypothetical protein
MASAVPRGRGGEEDSLRGTWRQASNSRAPAAMAQSDELAAALRQIGGGKPTHIAHPPRRTPTRRAHAAMGRPPRGGLSLPKVAVTSAHDRSLTLRSARLALAPSVPSAVERNPT